MRAGPKSAKSSQLPDLSKQHLSIKKNSCEKFELKKMRGVRYLLHMSNLPLKYVSLSAIISTPGYAKKCSTPPNHQVPTTIPL